MKNVCSLNDIEKKLKRQTLPRWRKHLENAYLATSLHLDHRENSDSQRQNKQPSKNGQNNSMGTSHKKRYKWPRHMETYSLAVVPRKNNAN